MAAKPVPRPRGTTMPDSALFSTLVASKPARAGAAGVLASATSVAIHVAVVGLLVWATMTVGQAEEVDDENIVPILIPVDEPPPPPPAPVVDEAPPVEAPADDPIGTRVISAPDFIPPDIPPPAVDSDFDPRDWTGVGPDGTASGTDSVVTSDDVAAAPFMVPMTVRPSIRNPDEVARALQRFYPPLLRDAGIGGTVVVWIRIDEEGDVVRTQLHESSGQPALDEAALRIGEVIEFTPAMNRDRRIPVWIQTPITFRPR